MTNTPHIAQQPTKILRCESAEHGYDELDVLSIEVRTLQEARAQEAFESVGFVAPEIEQGLLNFDGFAAINGFMNEHRLMGLMHTPSEWTFVPEARARAMVFYDASTERLTPDGLLTTEASQPFTGDMVVDFAGSAVLYDSSTGIGLTLHSSDSVLLYKRDNADLLSTEMNSERLKELMVASEKTNTLTNTLFVNKWDGQKPPQGTLSKVVQIDLTEAEDSAA